MGLLSSSGHHIMQVLLLHYLSAAAHNARIMDVLFASRSDKTERQTLKLVLVVCRKLCYHDINGFSAITNTIFVNVIIIPINITTSVVTTSPFCYIC